MSTPTKVYVKPGERVRVIGNYSEIMMHFKLAGTPIEIELQRDSEYDWTYGLIFVKGEPFSAPITTSEAGFHKDEGGYYAYADDGPGDADPKAVIAETSKLLAEIFNVPGVMVISDLGLNF